MMPKRQAEFRADYRPRISPWYSGTLHVVVIYAIGIAALIYFIRHIHNPSWAEWLVVPAVFLACNLFEWWIHKYVMHRPVAGFMGIYRRHTLAHHQFFTDAEPTIDTTRDFRITFFPPYALVTFIAMSIPPALALGFLWSANAGWLLMCTTVGMYLNYEFFHWGCHVKDDRVIRHVPLMNTIRRHHIAHHNQAIMMERNFNLTYPIADWLFGTSDLVRGVLGHVFNGYDKSHVRAGLEACRNARTSGDGLKAERMTAPLDKLGAPPARLKRSQASLVGGIACGIGVAILTVLLLGDATRQISRSAFWSARRSRSGCVWPISEPRFRLVSPGEPRRALFEKRRGALAIILAVERFADQRARSRAAGFRHHRSRAPAECASCRRSPAVRSRSSAPRTRSRSQRFRHPRPRLRTPPRARTASNSSLP